MVSRDSEPIKVDDMFIEIMDTYREPDKSKGLLGASSENVIVFAEKMLGIRLYAWQVKFLHRIQEAIEDSGLPREYLAMTSRQIGKSTAIAVLSVWACVFNKYSGTVAQNTLIGIISASDRQAKDLLRTIKRLIHMGDAFMAKTYVDNDGQPLFGKEFFSSLLDEHEPNNTTTVTFKKYDADKHGDFVLKGSLLGSTIESYPPTSVVLGRTFTIVIVDEAGMSDRIDDEFFYEELYPTGNSTNAVRIYTSTPWVLSGFFYRMVDPDNIYPPNDVQKFVFTIDAIELENPNYYKSVKKTIDLMNQDGKMPEVQRAYYCRFVKGDSNYFDPIKVSEVFTDEYLMYDKYDKPCDIGIDFGGKVNSRTVVTISEMQEDGTIRRLYSHEYEVNEDETLLDDVAELKKRFNIQRVVYDDCPAATYLIKEMMNRGWELQPMPFRTDKVKKYGGFRSKLNQGKVKSYNDSKLKEEMNAMENSKGSRQSVIQHAPGYTDDRIDSFVLSCYFFVDEEVGLKTYSWEGDDSGSKSRASKWQW